MELGFKTSISANASIVQEHCIFKMETKYHLYGVNAANNMNTFLPSGSQAA